MAVFSVFRSVVRSVVPEHLRPYGYLTELARTRTSCTVRSGPFEGMRYVRFAQGSAYIPKLLGIYERELAPYVERAVARQPRLVIDLGAAEGYYAVGMARRLPLARILAFEADAGAREAVCEMAAMNAVDSRVMVLGRCEPADLASALEISGDDTLVICDVEGYEERLLDPAVVPLLRRLPVLVELHDFIVPGVTDLLAQRFSATHDITHIWQQDRSRRDFPWRTPGTLLLPRSYVDWAVSELRPVRMAWFWMEPKGR
jgi:hypothetical protein